MRLWKHLKDIYTKMKKLISIIVIFCFISCSQKAEWIYLFDGKTTDGWRGYNSEVMPPGWIAKNGVLTFETEKRLDSKYKGGRDIIYVKEEFENFELYLEWKIPEGGNSGILYHVVEGYSVPSEASPEYQLIDDLKWGEVNNSSLENWQKTAADYAMHDSNQTKNLIKDAGEWNSSKIIFTPSKVEHWLNGELVLSFIPWSEDWYKRKEVGKWKDYPDYGKYKKGFIALQDHDSPLSFREIKIKKL
tara:strand:- start:2956 stop:3693 length:738 start_codon:yes stop_codon:yes gene_type:complete